MNHREVPVQITAWVDEGVAPLVEALNKIEGLITLDSSQEGVGWYAGKAYVCFITRDPGQLQETALILRVIIAAENLENTAEVVTWEPEYPMGCLLCSPGVVKILAEAIEDA